MKIPQVVAALLQAAAISGSSRWVARARKAVSQVRPSDVSPGGTTPRQLLVDVSIIATHDGGTGIQRVVRSILAELIHSPPSGFAVRPVMATRKKPYRYAYAYASMLGAAPSPGLDKCVEARDGDVFLGLDLSSRVAPSRQREFLTWRATGVRLAFVVYDLLPASNPRWFTRRARRDFERWLRLISIHADSLLCISNAVADDAKAWLEKQYGLSAPQPSFEWFHLGADAPSPRHEIVCPTPLLEQHTLDMRSTVLMVGTIEPRKGHAQVLNAFERLWQNGHDAVLVVAGRAGWNMSELIARLRSHPESGRRLIWLENAHDGHLAWLYRNMSGLLQASEAEGFGLPLIEAAQYGMPILARDLPVFREIAGAHASYFNGRECSDIASQLATWLVAIKSGTAPDSRQLPVMNWHTATERLKTLLLRV
ncbi:glycosyltransferase family 4 protein [Burkholderia cenocepacia]|uniref:glycosyltransferase family 4 protein n=1 Tax=Burkholderia cenocepacia TaxID=95486 RepID=UPI0032C235B0